ncbi:MAG: tRNA (adenosine(37)-N6)-dimethylallyltransferase MiaA, partial [Tenericutes bacterium]|nr:tRNA (adenosine(37)-N6)-dimethylallyltransferase MiaA [Mycoplasmatota bacterium]
VGPTGVGKTTLSIALAKHYKAEIISCDSMQFYKGLDIGTAKIMPEEKCGIKHHLLDVLDIDAEFSVAKYQKIVRNKINELQSLGIMPILVGGSGLYISSIVYNYQFLGTKRDSHLSSQYQDKSLKELVEMLQSKSPVLADSTDLDNKRRVIRALEKSDNDIDSFGKDLYYDDLKLIALDLDRDILYERINNRVDEMINLGLVNEVECLYQKNIESQAFLAIGYKELFQYFKGITTFDEAIVLIKRNSRRYAKRQLTWFRNKLDCHWLNVDINNFDITINEAIKYLNKK